MFPAQALENDLEKKRNEIRDLQAKCRDLDSFSDVSQAVSHVSNQLAGLDQVLAEAHEVARLRNSTLQVRHL